MTSTRFEPLTLDSAPAGARPLLTATRQNFGFVPSPVAKAARSPLLLKQLLAGLTGFEHSSLSPLEREVVAMTMAFENGCHYCMALHSAQLSVEPKNALLLEQLRAGSTLSDGRLEALRQFVLALAHNRGQVAPETWQQLLAVGFSEEQALEALAGAGAYWLSTIGNVLMGAELDAPFAPFVWSKPDTTA